MLLVTRSCSGTRADGKTVPRRTRTANGRVWVRQSWWQTRECLRASTPCMVTKDKDFGLRGLRSVGNCHCANSVSHERSR